MKVGVIHALTYMRLTFRLTDAKESVSQRGVQFIAPLNQNYHLQHRIEIKKSLAKSSFEVARNLLIIDPESSDFKANGIFGCCLVRGVMNK